MKNLSATFLALLAGFLILPAAQASPVIINVQLSDTAVREMTRILKEEGATVVASPRSKRINIEFSVSKPSLVNVFEQGELRIDWGEIVSGGRNYDRVKLAQAACTERQMDELREAFMTEVGQNYLARSYRSQTNLNLTIFEPQFDPNTNVVHRVVYWYKKPLLKRDYYRDAQEAFDVAKTQLSSKLSSSSVTFSDRHPTTAGEQISIKILLSPEKYDLNLDECPEEVLISRASLAQQFAEWNEKWDMRFGSKSVDQRVRNFLNNNTSFPVKE
jgi:hypothetical protein